MIARLESASPGAVAFWTGILSLLISLVCILQDMVINNDAILYMDVIRHMAVGDYAAAVEVYRWPWAFLPAARLHAVFGLEPEIAGWINGAGLIALTCAGFVLWSAQCYNGKVPIWIAGLVVLIFPYLNGTRADILRDPLYWAIWCWAGLVLMQFLRSPGIGKALLWGCLLVVGGAARLEAFVMLLLIPLLVFWLPDKSRGQKISAFLQLNLVPLAGLAGLLAVQVIAPDAMPVRVSEIGGQLERLGHMLGTGLADKADLIATHILNVWSDDYAMASVISILAGMFVIKVFNTLGVVYVLLAAVGYGQRQASLQSPAGRVMVWLVLLNMAVLGVFLVNEFFLSGRYLVPLTLTLMILVPPGLYWLYRQASSLWGSQAWLKTARIVTGLAMFVLLADGLLTTGENREYMRDAGHWIRDQAAPQTPMLANHKLMAYYSGLKAEPRYDLSWDNMLAILGSEQRHKYGIIALRIHRKHPERLEQVETLLGRPASVTFEGSKGTRMAVFKDLPQQPTSQANPKSIK